MRKEGWKGEDRYEGRSILKAEGGRGWRGGNMESSGMSKSHTIHSNYCRENYVGSASELTFWLEGFLLNIIRGD